MARRQSGENPRGRSQWREANPDKVLAISRKWREANREKAREAQRKWEAAKKPKTDPVG
jgi:hypothetical protein